MGREELMRATDDLTRVEFPCDWNWIRSELAEARQKIRKVKGSGNKKLVHWYYYNENILFKGLLSGAGLLNEYLSTEVGPLPENLSEYNTGSLKDFDRIVDFMGRFGWVVLLMSMVEFGNYGSPMEREKRTLSFSDLFRPEYRDTIPDEVLTLLGPGYAGAWKNSPEGKKEWSYDNKDRSVITPFFILEEMKFIKIPSKGKKDFITTWLKVFGIEYKTKTFDKPSEGEPYHYFKGYLSKLEK